MESDTGPLPDKPAEDGEDTVTQVVPVVVPPPGIRFGQKNRSTRRPTVPSKLRTAPGTEDGGPPRRRRDGRKGLPETNVGPPGLSLQGPVPGETPGLG